MTTAEAPTPAPAGGSGSTLETPPGTPAALVSFGPEIAGELEPALRREWLVTNGLGGYAAGTVAGPATRVYHGLLVAALRPPVARTMAVGGLVEWATAAGRRVALHAHEYADGTIDQRGFEQIEQFRLEGTRPVWTFALGDVRLEKRIWMEHGRNTTYVRYAVLASGPPRSVELELIPLLAWRDHHATGSAFEPRPRATPVDDLPGWSGVGVRFHGAEAETRLLVDHGAVEPAGDWFRDVHHRAETERGLPDRSDLLAAARVRATVRPDEPLTLVLTTEPGPPAPAADALAAEVERERALLARAGAGASSVVATLARAADAFLVDRAIPDPSGGPARPGRSIIAGYPWFNDWGRDTMIALPGLCLATGRHDEARAILRSFAAFVGDGLLPNNFPDVGDEEPGRNTVDASLWYPLATAAYVDATGDDSLVDELLPTFRDILDHHVAGTRYGIAADSDGLLRAGEPGVQLTWMDAKVGDWVVTPRIGKPVEIQALWINALRLVGGWAGERGDPAADGYLALADRATRSFGERFWLADRGHLADVVDGPDGDDPTLRPNQLLALSLPHPLVGPEVATAVLDAVGRSLETPVGLRSLSPDHPAFAGRYGGDARSRDGVYHQGTVWAWLVGPYVDGLVRFGGDRGRERARGVLEGLVRHLGDGGLGSVSEIFDGDPPFRPRGCPWQAWSVAELLRAWRSVTGE